MMLGRAFSHVALRLNRHCTRMAGARPWGQQQQDPGLRMSTHGVTLPRVELDEETRGTADLVAGRRRDLHLA